MTEHDADQKGIANGMRQALGALPEPDTRLEQLLARLRDAEAQHGPDRRDPR